VYIAADQEEDSMKEDFRRDDLENESATRDGSSLESAGGARDRDTSTGHSNYHDDPDDFRDQDSRSGPYRDEIFSKRVPAGKRTYFFDVKTTRSGRDYFLTITESKRVDEHRYEKHKIFLYKEDFGKFVSAMHEVVRFIQDECLPGYDFHGLPDVSAIDGELDGTFTGDGDSY